MAAASAQVQQEPRDQFINPEIPQNLTWNVKCQNFDEYKAMILAIYSTLRPMRAAEGPGMEYVTSSYCNSTNAQLRDTFRPLHPALSDARNTPLWSYRLLKMVKDPPTMTRTMLRGLVEELDNDEVNDILKNLYHVEGTDSPENETLPVEYVQRYILEAMAGLEYSHKKARRGYELYSWYDKYTAAVQELNLKVDTMLLNLCDRNTVNALATEVGRTRQSMIQACEQYAKMKDVDQIKNSFFALQNFKDLNGFNFGRFRTSVQTGYIWLHHYTLEDPEQFTALSIKEISDVAGKLTPLVKEIRGFHPSPLDLAQDKAARVKVAVANLREDIEKFSDDRDTRNLAKAKTLVSSLTFYKEKCEQLRIEGVPYTEESLGATPAQMAEAYEEVFKYIQDEEQEIKKREHRARLEANEVLKTAPNISLPPLNSVADWLNFQRSLERIMPFHNSDIVKCAIVKKALRDRADISRCQNLNYESMISYLNSRYNDSSLLPRLVDRLLAMKPVRDNYTSYNNLTEFLSVYAQLELHKGTDRLDSFVREKLVALLLPQNLQCDFLSDQIKQEHDWKKETTNADDDDTSSTFSLAKGEDYEDKRRAMFVKSMRVYSEIMRKLVATNHDGQQKSQRKNNTGANNITPRDKPCPACDSYHYGKNGSPSKSLASCPKFRDMPVLDRYHIVTQANYCKKCLSRTDDGQHTKGCKKSEEQKRKCRQCNSVTHHEMLHFPDGPPSRKPKANGAQKKQPKKTFKKQKSPKKDKNSTHAIHATESPQEQSSTAVNLTTPETHLAIRMFLSACTYCTLQLPGNQIAVKICLVDVGAGLNMVTNKAAAELKLKQIRVWKGVISTINGTKEGEYPVYQINIKDVHGNVNKIAALGIDNIGTKASIPPNLFNKVCDSLKVSPTMVQNTSGEIDILIGLESREYLANPVVKDQSATACPDFPGIALYSSKLSPLFMIIGAIGPTLADSEDVCTRMYSVSFNQCLHIDTKTAEITTIETSDEENEDNLNNTDATPNTTDDFSHCPNSTRIIYADDLNIDNNNSVIYADDTTPTENMDVLVADDSNGANTSFTVYADDSTASTSKISEFADDVTHIIAPERSSKHNSRHNHDMNNASLYNLNVKQEVTCVQMPPVISQEHLDGSQANIFTMLEIKKTAANLNLLDADPTPGLTCPGCKAIISKCQACRYLSTDLSIQDLQDLQILKDNIYKVEDPEDKERFYVFFDYVFKHNPAVIYRPELTNRGLARKSALRLRAKLIKEGLMEAYQKEMQKSIDHGHFVLVEGAVKDEFDKLNFENFINLNYVIKISSMSQAIRPVSDSTAWHRSGDLNSNLIAGPQSLNNPLYIVIRFLWNPVGLCMDFSRCYRTIVTGPSSNTVRRFWWFLTPDNEDSIREFCLARLNYGDNPSSAVLEEAIRSHVSPHCETEEGRDILCNRRYVDDTMSSFLNHEQRIRVQEDIIRASSKGHFIIKHSLYSHCGPVDGETFTNVLGQRWDFTRDILLCNILINPHAKKRGKPCGPPLNEEIAMTIPISKTTMCRAAGQAFSYTQATLLPVTMALRIIFSKVSMLSQDWHYDVSRDDEEFTKEVRRTLVNLSNLPDKILPAPRAVLLDGYRVWRILASSDGSSTAAAAVIHIVTINDSGDTRVVNLLARGKIVTTTVPAAELTGTTMAVSMVSELFDNVPELHDIPVDVVFSTDSLCVASSMNMRKLFKSVKTRNSAFMVNRKITDLVKRFEKIHVRYCHIESQSCAADLATKLVPDPASLTNSSLWREGPPCYLDPSWPHNSTVFLEASANKPLEFKQPQAAQHIQQQSAGLYVTCTNCKGHSDFCGAPTQQCSFCTASDGSCYQAHLHSDNSARDPSAPQVDHTFIEEDIDDPPCLLPYTTYCFVVVNCRSLRKCLGVVVLFYRLAAFFRRRRADKTTRFAAMFPEFPSSHELGKAWRTILRSTQKYFPPQHVSSWHPFLDSNRILRARTRYADGRYTDGIIQIASPPLVSHQDHRLATLVVRHHHLRHLPNMSPLHLPSNITIGNIRNSKYAVELTMFRRFVKMFIKACVGCTRLTTQPLTAALSNPRWLRFIQQKVVVFKVCSIDPIGPIWFRPTSRSRGAPLKAYCLIVSCMLTTSTSAYMMVGISRNDILLALSTHCQRYTRPKILYVDAGSAVNLDPDNDDWYWHLGDPDIEVVRLQTEEFHSSYVESKIKVMKKMLRSATCARKSSHLPVMTLPMLTNFFDTLTNLLNSRPLFATADGEFILTANHLLKSFISLEDMSSNTLDFKCEDEIEKFQRQLTELSRSMAIGVKLFMDNLKYTFLSDTEKHKILKIQSELPRPGDVLLVSRRGELTLGVCEKTTGQFCWVRRKRYSYYVTEKINIRKLFLLHRPFSASTPPAKDKEVIEFRLLRGYIQQRANFNVRRGGNHVIISHSFDDILINRNYQYYTIEDGLTRILSEPSLLRLQQIVNRN